MEFDGGPEHAGIPDFAGSLTLHYLPEQNGEWTKGHSYLPALPIRRGTRISYALAHPRIYWVNETLYTGSDSNKGVYFSGDGRVLKLQQGLEAVISDLRQIPSGRGCCNGYRRCMQNYDSDRFCCYMYDESAS